jgi:hypothetical protein
VWGAQTRSALETERFAARSNLRTPHAGFARQAKAKCPSLSIVWRRCRCNSGRDKGTNRHECLKSRGNPRISGGIHAQPAPRPDRKSHHTQEVAGSSPAGSILREVPHVPRYRLGRTAGIGWNRRIIIPADVPATVTTKQPARGQRAKRHQRRTGRPAPPARGRWQ